MVEESAMQHHDERICERLPTKGVVPLRHIADYRPMTPPRHRM